MLAVRVAILRYIDDAFPGVVELELVDTRERRWLFHEKVPVVTHEALDATSVYPRPGLIACELIARDGQIARVSTARPWGIESIEGETEFDVFVELLVSEAEI
jgi:hypothetical protein